MSIITHIKGGYHRLDFSKLHDICLHQSMTIEDAHFSFPIIQTIIIWFETVLQKRYSDIDITSS